MDRTLKYVNMCLKAEEIQKIWKEAWPTMEDGSFYIPPKPDDLSIDIENWVGWMVGCLGVSYHALMFYPSGGATWLPRQDELQHLSGLSWQAFDVACLAYKLDTKEQAGICVVMNERYGKRWINGEWSEVTKW